MTVLITLPAPISQELQSALQAKIKSEFNLSDQDSFETVYDSNLVFGYQIKLNNTIYDHSFASFINTKLSLIQTKLNN